MRSRPSAAVRACFGRAALARALDLKNAVHIGHSTGGGEVARYVARAEKRRVAKAVLMGAVPPLMLKTSTIRAVYRSRCSTASVRRWRQPRSVLPRGALGPLADGALLSAKLVRNATLKVYKGFPHGMATIHAEVAYADLLTFVKG
jgi:pimeloyl-ACP methyl ester carboxylesterase